MSGLERFGISQDELRDMIRKDADVNSQLNDFMRDEVVPFWKSIAPQDEGDYRASIKVTKKAKNGVGRVGATDFKAHWIEYGTGDPAPTQEYAPAQQTAAKFGGTIKGIDVDTKGDDE